MNELTPDENKILVDAIHDSATIIHTGKKMNERIQELANEAGLPTYNPQGIPTKLEKFAELIVRECMEQIWYTREDMINENISEVIKERMKQHFGVEE